MANCRSLTMMLLALCAVAALADVPIEAIGDVPIQPVIPTSPAPPQPTPKTTPQPPTPKPTPPTTTTSTTTVKPTEKPTTTAKPTEKPTTTAKPTDKPTTPTTPPPKTTTSTAKPQPTTPAPSPVDPKEGTWVANYTGTNRTCVIVQAAVQISLEYKEGNATKKLAVNVPTNATAVGDCADKEKQSIALSWSPRENVTDSATFNFEKVNGTDKFDLKSIGVALNLSIPGQGFKVLSLEHQKEEFATPVSKSYKCARQQSLNLTLNEKINVTATLRVSHVQLQAFRNATNKNFDSALDCSSSETPDVVPIAVGCALAALVIIVLVAYLVGRRRSQARGYLSM